MIDVIEELDVLEETAAFGDLHQARVKFRWRDYSVLENAMSKSPSSFRVMLMMIISMRK